MLPQVTGIPWIEHVYYFGHCREQVGYTCCDNSVRTPSTALPPLPVTAVGQIAALPLLGLPATPPAADPATERWQTWAVPGRSPTC